MNNADIRRYERELKKSLRDLRLKKQISKAFTQSLPPLLEEIPNPSYDDLVAAFGPPDHLAQALLQTVEIPQPIPPWKKLALCFCGALAVGVVCFGGFSLWNAPENETFFPDTTHYTEAFLQENYSFAVNESFSHGDVEWGQPRDMAAYLILLENTNSVPTNISVRYSQHRPPHTFPLAPGETLSFAVNDPRPGEHSVAFDTPDGSLSGTVRVLLSDTPIE